MYPNYTTAWNVKATLNGDLLIENKVYPYLFWEGNIPLQASDINTNEGFLISKENTTSF